MAFIKRSTTKIEKVTVGKRMKKCASCGLPFVGKQTSATCPQCSPQPVNDGTVEDMPDFDLDLDTE